MLEWDYIRKSITDENAGMRSHENQGHIDMLEWGAMRINNTSVC